MLFCTKIIQTFKFYEKLNIIIEIPKFISTNFESLELKNLTDDGAKELMKKWEDAESQVVLPEFLGFCDLHQLFEPYLSKYDLSSFFTTTKNLRKQELPHRRAVVTLADILGPENEKMEFVRNNKLMLNCVLNTEEDFLTIEKLKTANIIDKIEACLIGFDVSTKNQIVVQNFINSLNETCPKVRELNFKSLNTKKENSGLGLYFSHSLPGKVELSFPKDLNLKSLAFNSIVDHVYLHSDMIKLEKLSCHSICGATSSLLELTAPKNEILDLYFGLIGRNSTIKLPEMNHLANLSVMFINISSFIILPNTLENLVNLYFGHINSFIKLPDILPKLKYVKSDSEGPDFSIMYPQLGKYMQKRNINSSSMN